MQSLPEFTPGYLVASVPLRDTITVADRVGAIPEWVATAAALAALGLAIATGLRQRRAMDVRSTDPEPTQEPVP